MKGKAGIVTGGASGIGRAVVESLLAAGAHVHALDRNQTALDELAQEFGLGMLGLVEADVTDVNAIERAVRECVDKHGRIDFLVNAAGIVHSPVPIHEVSDEEFNAVQAVNLFGSFALYRAIARVMIDRGTGGAIINISSTAGIRPVPNAGIYTASKHGVIGLTTTAALELAPHGIRVNAVCPGVIDTPLFRANAVGGAAEAIMKMIPLARLGQSGEVAELVVWLLSDRASYVTGAVIPVDGGVSLV